MPAKPKPQTHDEQSSKQAKVSQSDLPSADIATAVKVAQGIQDQLGGKIAAPHDVALALPVSPTSSAWRMLSGAAVAYGITNGAYNAQSISLTELGRRIVAPLTEGDDEVAITEAVLKPRVLKEFFQRYDRSKFPRDDIARNVLAQIGVPQDRLDRALEIVKQNGRAAGLIRDTKTGPFVALSRPSGREQTPPVELETGDTEIEVPVDASLLSGSGPEVSKFGAADAPQSSGPKQIFVAHGKNQKPLEDLKRILDQFKIPYKVAVDEPNVGRPISRKVAQLMRECSAGIFIFTGDEQFTGIDGEVTFRPSENVVYELGAASVLWENKIIILKQRDVNFPSDFKDLGYLEFDEANLANQALGLLKELVGLNFVKVHAA